LIGEGKNSPERRYRQFVESGIAQNDRELEEAMELSSKAIGAADYCREVEEQHKTHLQGLGDPTQVAMRQIEVGQDPERVLEVAARAFKVEKEALTRGRRRTPARCLAMLLLVELAGWKGAQVAKRMGIGDSSGVSQCIKSWRKQSETARSLKVLEETVRLQITGK